MKPNEAAFEEYVATWLVEHVGYDHLKGPGQARPPAFDPVTGIDTEDLFEFIGSDPGQRVGAAQAAPRYAGDLAAMLSEAVRETRARLYQALDLELLLDPVGQPPTLDVRLQLCGGGGRI
ncbi:MAG TPA: hypothetical protein VNO51_25730 [Ilumatobacteraceae bacterium]|nr:hypothetical protein [Ilumatobacteraceae bacterium]